MIETILTLFIGMFIGAAISFRLLWTNTYWPRKKGFIYYTRDKNGNKIRVGDWALLLSATGRVQDFPVKVKRIEEFDDQPFIIFDEDMRWPSKFVMCKIN